MGYTRVIRTIQRRIKNKAIKRTARCIKKVYFVCVEKLGTALFFLGRKCKFVEPLQPYSKDTVKNILVVRTDRIGDVILSTPAVRALRQSFPESFIAFLTTSYTEELVRYNEDINQVMVYQPHSSLLEKRDFFRTLREREFDLALVLCPYFSAAFIAYLSGAAHRVGYPANGCRFLLTMAIDIDNIFRHERETALEVVRAIGADTHQKRPHLVIDAASHTYAEVFFVQNNITFLDTVVAIHPGGYEAHTQWPSERYAELIRILLKHRNVKVILLGGPRDQQTVAAVKGRSPESVVVAPHDNSLLQVAAIMKRCAVFVGNNSGPMHIAAAAGIPVVALFGPIHPLEHENKWAPYGEEHIIVRKHIECDDCHPGHCEHIRCRELIEVSDVVDAVTIVLKRTKKSREDAMH